ncbi:MAG: group III truncated hemoglobin [Crocinitomicaceae bacterium]|nr:group III truncated hemoglobin [Crocinitomicaceae bacterium]
MKDIEDMKDIQLLVNSFYTEVRKDKDLGPIFEAFIKNWEDHLKKMYRFWQTILLNEKTYNGSPFPPHVKLPIKRQDFDIWIQLFEKTINQHFKGEKAEEAKNKARQIAQVFSIKLQYIKEQ